jgi:hypothetical protein
LGEATIETWVKWNRLLHGVPVFNFGLFGSEIGLTAGTFRPGNVVSTATLEASLSPGPNEHHFADVTDVLRTNEWYHVAVVTGSGGIRLYVNGVLAQTNEYTGDLRNLVRNDQNWLGRSRYADAVEFTGQIDEFRIWKTQRTAEQIRENMFKSVTGKEGDLFAVWNFDDVSQLGRDAASGGHDGRLIGSARVVDAELPRVVSGIVTDASGTPVPKAGIEIRQAGQPDRRVLANDVGEYAFSLSSSAPCDLFATTGRLSAYRLGFRPGAATRQTLDWVLAGIAAGPAASPSLLSAPPRVHRLPAYPPSVWSNRAVA